MSGYRLGEWLARRVTRQDHPPHHSYKWVAEHDTHASRYFTTLANARYWIAHRKESSHVSD